MSPQGSLLNLEYLPHSKVIAFADDLIIIKGKSILEIENYANVEMHKIATWVSENKIIFNSQKS